MKAGKTDFGVVFKSHYLFRGFNAQENLEIANKRKRI
jgi:ABC-type lipoprotein export system ATPase subunit